MLKNKLLIFLPILIQASAIIAQSPQQKGLDVINKQRLQSQLNYFASDWFEGRQATTRGAGMAADYLASLYGEAGLMPAGDNHTFLQHVPLVIASQPQEALFSVTANGIKSKFTYGRDFSLAETALGFRISGAAMWGGYELEIKNDPKVKNPAKILIRMAGLPSDASEEMKKLTPAELNKKKHQIALKAGVTAILEYDNNDPYLRANINHTMRDGLDASAEKPQSGIYDHKYLLPDELKLNIPVIKVSKSVMQILVPDFETAMENGKTPKIAGTVSLSCTASAQYADCRNVLAMIPGSQYPNEIIVVGGHYDHLGSHNGFIWNGADDNGSGAIGTVAIATAFKATGIQPKRTIIFANWTAEERGLLGSRFFVNHFDKIEQVKYYHNYDMIGRSYDANKSDMAVSLLFTDTWKQAGELSEQFNNEYRLGLNLNLSPWDNPTGGSDNGSFAQKGIPIMWYHTGGHPDYHQPTDHSERIDWQKMEGIIKNSFLTLWHLANE